VADSTLAPGSLSFRKAMAGIVGLAFGAVNGLAAFLGYAVLLTVVATEVMDARRKRQPGTTKPKELNPAHFGQ